MKIDILQSDIMEAATSMDLVNRPSESFLCCFFLFNDTKKSYRDVDV